MKKLQRLVFSGLLVLTLAFGLAGCGSNHDSSKSSTSKDKVTKVVKKSSNKDKSSHKKSSQSESDENSNSANSNATTNDSESSTSSSSQSSSSQKQLGLNDVAVWTDENGITHHVDSDGMDRQTSPNQSGVTYKDWSGSLPSNAQIVKQN
ncbi:hypothetical protein N4599_09035 [Limosilactobacillus oris]|uniref:hypothetical protein n=1 Tax=Limosilactobacillus oris TaxID=1632 RepID=UPI0021B2A4C7|nr:hypothetical protein [Limosilactobacillus oris]UXC67233.1 hypothetical protein N4599_09035 [Limosilactobacillus oris]